MSLCKRIIARLDIKGSRLIKGVRFEGVRVIGDPWEKAKSYADDGIDELLYVDAVASLYGRNSLGDLLRKTSENIFIPITAGGGIRSVKDAVSLLSAGADKVAINSAILRDPLLISEISERLGSQCVVASIQARKVTGGTWEAMAESGREKTGRDVIDWIQEVQLRGAGEILLTSVDNDGTCSGPDLDLIRKAATVANVPLIVGGGFSDNNDVAESFELPKISAVSIGAAFHREILSTKEIKSSLSRHSPCKSYELRETYTDNDIIQYYRRIEGKKIGIVDYSMGNQQSLRNAFEKLNAKTLITDNISELEKCDLVALPGVGAFPDGMLELKKRGLDQWIKEWAQLDRPLIGICLGMQMFFEDSEEFKFTKGLGLIKGNVKRFNDVCRDGQKLVLPHVGWNQVNTSSDGIVTKSYDGISQYFVHSYIATGVCPKDIVLECRYGETIFPAAVQRKNIVGFQFHPERSGISGLALLSSVCGDLLR